MFSKSAWLSGFIDAEGCFSVGFRSTRNEISLRFILDQKNEPVLLETVAKLLGSGLVQKRTGIEGMQRYVLSVTKVLTERSFSRDLNEQKQLGLKALLDYLDQFPLKSEKNINYVRFKKI
jgi:hypothetical protein